MLKVLIQHYTESLKNNLRCNGAMLSICKIQWGVTVDSMMPHCKCPNVLLSESFRTFPFKCAIIFFTQWVNWSLENRAPFIVPRKAHSWQSLTQSAWEPSLDRSSKGTFSSAIMWHSANLRSNEKHLWSPHHLSLTYIHHNMNLHLLQPGKKIKAAIT